ncbi:hypothetical protein OROHE_005758 [Orobanche hederae]
MAAMGISGELDRNAALKGAPIPSGWSGDVDESPDAAWWEDVLAESVIESGLDLELPSAPLPLTGSEDANANPEISSSPPHSQEPVV